MKPDRFQLISQREILRRKIEQVPSSAKMMRRQLWRWLSRLERLIKRADV